MSTPDLDDDIRETVEAELPGRTCDEVYRLFDREIPVYRDFKQKNTRRSGGTTFDPDFDTSRPVLHVVRNTSTRALGYRGFRRFVGKVNLLLSKS